MRGRRHIFSVMFCSSYGAECSSSAKFRGQCSQINEAVKQTSKKVDEGGASVALTFKQFKTRKEEDRKGCFRNKRPAKKAKLAHQPDSEVKININIGIMVLRDRGLIAKRGLTVTESIGAEELLEKAVVKHHRLNKDVVRNSSKVFYHLLYADKNLVLINRSRSP